ncbi:hypothetical protein DFH06DRAFT_1477067 [Mycena polygramma]|nr:hypothetical protein DFH06DRAFT_1477067 [Mycena polygramma]
MSTTPTAFASASDVERANGTGLLVDSSSGSTKEIPQERWSEFLSCVADATKALKENGGGSWSRPQEESCPTDVFYDLGPADTKDEFVKFQLTGHEVDVGEPKNILRWIKGNHEVVDEIPPPLVKLESAISDLRKARLRKWDSPMTDTKKLLEAVDGMESCPVDMNYHLGPAETKDAFMQFTLTDHEGPPNAILRYRYIDGKHCDDIVAQIPPSIVQLQSAISSLTKAQLLKWDSPLSDTKELLEALNDMASICANVLLA